MNILCSKRSEKGLKILDRLGNVGLKEAYIVEKDSGLPKKFKVPRPIIPSIKIKKRLLDGKSRRII